MPLWQVLTIDTKGPAIPRPLIYSHSYKHPGRKLVNVTMSDTPFVDDGSGQVPYAVLSSGLPPPVAKVEFDVVTSVGRNSIRSLYLTNTT